MAMLPIKSDQDNERVSVYNRNLDIYKGEHYKHFNFDEQEKKINSYEYICYGLFRTAIETKVNLIWREAPTITFTSKQTQKAFDQLRKSTNFDYIQQQVTAYSYVFGDCLAKIAIDDNGLTVQDDKQLALFIQSPINWYPEHNEFSPMRPASSDTLLFKREIKEGFAYLLETHRPGYIIWTAYFETSDENIKNENNKEAEQVPVLRYFEDILTGVIADQSVDETTMVITYTTNCTYSLLQRLKSRSSIDSYYGLSDLSLPVLSKINALNNYANLADVIIVTNSFPKLILSENANNILKRIIEEYNISGNKETNGREGVVATSEDLDLTRITGNTFLSRQSYAQSYAYRQLINEMRAFVDGGEGGQTKYLTNDFSLKEIRDQHDIFFKSIMSELNISEVFYNPSLSTGTLSGTAYKRLMTTTLNDIEVKKRTLEPYLERVVYTMLELANNNGLIKAKPEMPKVKFHDGLVNDEMEDLQILITKVQNKFLPLKEAMKLSENITEEEAIVRLEEIANQMSYYNAQQAQNNSQQEDAQNNN